MFVRTKMTANPFTVTPEDRVTEATEVMRTRHVRHLPVVRDGQVVGVVSGSDIAAASPSKATTLSAGESRYLLSKLTVGKIMSKHPVTIGPDALLEQAATLMRDHKIEMLPVVEGERLVGVITESSILDAFIEMLGFRDHGTRLTIDAPDEPGVLSRLTGITGHYRANITHLAVYRGQGDRSTVVLGLNTTNTADIEREMNEGGFRILATLTND